MPTTWEAMLLSTCRRTAFCPQTVNIERSSGNDQRLDAAIEFSAPLALIRILICAPYRARYSSKGGRTIETASVLRH
jgi:hypothetical protein